MSWSNEAWRAIEPIYQDILKSEFVTQLGDGSLSRERFITYMQQDKLYLNDYARALAFIAARASDPEDTALFAKFSQGAIEAEQGLHDFYLAFFGDAMNQSVETSAVKKNVACELYTSFLIRHCSSSPIEIAAAAVLPCFWIYDAVGIHHKQQLEKLATKSDHPYAKWIEMYSGADFSEDTNKARAFVDKLAENASPESREEMIAAFVKTSMMELMFWNAAWNNEKWIL